MVNHAVHYGAGVYGDPFKVPIIENLPPEWNVFVISRIKGEPVLRRKAQVTCLFDHEVFGRRISGQEVLDAERWLGHPFSLIITYHDPKALSRGGKKIREYSEDFARMVIAYRDFFTKNKIELFTTTMERTYAEVVGYLVAKRLGIRMLNVGPGRLTNTYSVYAADFNPFMEDVPDSEVPALMDSLHKSLTRKKEVLYPQIRDAVKDQYAVGISSLYGRLKGLIKYYPFYYSVHPSDRLRFLPPLELMWDFILKGFRRLVIPSYYDKIDMDKEKFFLFPLHFTEDAQILYREPFVEQFELIEKISKMLPEDVFLYVKPHPHWLCVDVPLARIAALKKLYNVKFIPANTNTYDLLSKTRAVITINSSVGLEAVLENRPLITVGHDFYAKKDVSIVVRDLNDLPPILSAVLNDADYGMDKAKREKFLSSFYKQLIFIGGGVGFKETVLTDEDGKKIADAMKAAYEKYFKR